MTKIAIMGDIESLGLDARTVVSQLAFVAWDQDDPESLIREVEEYLPIQPQLTPLKRTVRADTILWWMRQDDAARKRFDRNSGEDFDELSALVNSYLSKMRQVIESASDYEVWFKGPQFDAVAIESLAVDLGLQVPWAYDKVRDLRTMMKEAGLGSQDLPMRAGLVAHHALSDCKHQVDQLLESRKRLRAAV
jgi:hypothetical protein